MRRGSGELMSTAGNADNLGYERKNSTQIEIVLTLSAWLLISSVILLSGLVSRYRTPRNIYDAITLSAFLVYIGTLVTRSVLKARPYISVLVSSTLLTTTYYFRLLNILLSEQGKLILIPLVNIVDFGNGNPGVVALDLGQVGFYTLLYLTLTMLRNRYINKVKVKDISTETSPTSHSAGYA